ncbi:chorismate mutase [Brevibacillus dissolubilis]|uniref:chorismate mutase n=1 Tax=Brevibacillus dissolubilis TaxID=1844116 RepID=UPI0011170E77|nr:chorismate mutase [Brevibacillus dissolubilis]
MGVRGIRGAVTVTANTEQEIVTATKELIQEIVSRNDLVPEDIVSVLFTTTQDLNAVFPPKAAREWPEWAYVPLMCAQEIPVEGSLPMCIRLLLHVNTDKSQKEIEHVFLRDAVKLRPDLANK